MNKVFTSFENGAVVPFTAGTDTLDFTGTGLKATDILLTQSSGNVIVKVTAEGDFFNRTVTLQPFDLYNIVVEGSTFTFDVSAQLYVDKNSGDNSIFVTSGHDQVIAQGGNDTINGLDGDDLIFLRPGMGTGYGNDVINGGLFTTEEVDNGIDTLGFLNATSAVNVDLTTGIVTGGAASSGATILYNSIENVRGTGFGDTITGYSDANHLIGNGGNDVIDGKAGNDLLEGGNGNDKLMGSGGADTLDGLSGVDTLIGGTGNDFFINDIVANGTNGFKLQDVMTENAGEGVDTLSAVKADDTVLSSRYTVVLGPNLDNLILYDMVPNDVTWLLNGKGNDLVNRLDGNAAGNQLEGLNGNDLLYGWNGKDTLIGGGGADKLYGGNGDDLLNFDNTDTLIDGGANTDTLRLTGMNILLDLTTKGDGVIKNIEKIDLTGTGNNTLKLNLTDAYAIQGTDTHVLYVNGNAGDTVQLDSGWTIMGEDVSSTPLGGTTHYDYYHTGTSDLYIQTTITVVPPPG